MQTISYTQARQHLSEAMIKAADDHTPVIITRKNGKSCVLISLDEYESLEETAYLLRSPANAKRLMDSIEELRAGKGLVKELED